MSQNSTTIEVSDPLLNYVPSISISTSQDDATAFDALDNVQVATGPGLGRDNECRICGDDIEADQGAVTHNGCKTSYHLSCAAKWVVPNLASSGRATCPLCRGEISIKGRSPAEVARMFAAFRSYVAQNLNKISTSFGAVWEIIVPRFEHLQPEVKEELRECTRHILTDYMYFYFGYVSWIGTFQFEHALMQMKDTDTNSQLIGEAVRSDLHQLTQILIDNVKASNTIELLKSMKAEGKVSERKTEYYRSLWQELDREAANSDKALVGVTWSGLQSLEKTLTEYIKVTREEEEEEAEAETAEEEEN